jgi:hypothetical protein
MLRPHAARYCYYRPATHARCTLRNGRRGGIAD